MNFADMYHGYYTECCDEERTGWILCKIITGRDFYLIIEQRK